MFCNHLHINSNVFYEYSNGVFINFLRYHFIYHYQCYWYHPKQTLFLLACRFIWILYFLFRWRIQIWDWERLYRPVQFYFHEPSLPLLFYVRPIKALPMHKVAVSQCVRIGADLQILKKTNYFWIYLIKTNKKNLKPFEMVQITLPNLNMKFTNIQCDPFLFTRLRPDLHSLGPECPTVKDTGHYR